MTGGRGDRGELWTRFRTALDAARKHAVILMVAIGEQNDELAIVSSGRVRAGFRDADRIAAQIRQQDSADGREASNMLMVARESAAPWLLRAPWLGSLSDALVALGRRGAVDSRCATEDREILIDLDIDRVDLSGLDLEAAQLMRVCARQSRWDGTVASFVEMEGCLLDDSVMTAACFDEASIVDCSFERSSLGRSSWYRANVVRSNFDGCALVDARLGRVMFSDCSFRGADLSVVHSTIPEGIVGASFLRCDLRGTNWNMRSVSGMRFVDCKFFGVRGAPLYASIVDVDGPDVSALGDGSMVVSEDELRRRWLGNG